MALEKDKRPQRKIVYTVYPVFSVFPVCRILSVYWVFGVFSNCRLIFQHCFSGSGDSEDRGDGEDWVDWWLLLVEFGHCGGCCKHLPDLLRFEAPAHLQFYQWPVAQRNKRDRHPESCAA